MSFDLSLTKVHAFGDVQPGERPVNLCYQPTCSDQLVIYIEDHNSGEELHHFDCHRDTIQAIVNDLVLFLNGKWGPQEDSKDPLESALGIIRKKEVEKDG